MGMMFARRRAEAQKKHDAAKAKAHMENHARALAAAKEGVEPQEIQKRQQEQKAK